MPEQHSFFSDENIAPELTAWIRDEGYNITSVIEQHLSGIADEGIIDQAFKNKQIILTRDNDFGKLIYTTTISFYIIIYLRPGHFDGSFHIPTIQKIIAHSGHFKPGTLIIANRIEDKIKIRIKHF